MKTILLSLICMISLFSCKKDDIRTTVPPVNTQSMNTYESFLADRWVLHTTDTYDAAGNLLGHQTHTDTISCMLDLRSTQSTANASANAWDALFGLGCAPSQVGWTCDGTYLTLANQQFYILLQSADSLKLRSPGMGYYISTLSR
jgi:uncharacterized protein with beta-barrel porin domain